MDDSTTEDINHVIDFPFIVNRDNNVVSSERLFVVLLLAKWRPML